MNLIDSIEMPFNKVFVKLDNQLLKEFEVHIYIITNWIFEFLCDIKFTLSVILR